MARFVAFVRGINVGGHNLIPMAELKSLCESAGLTGVSTLLQSGNVLFTTTRKDPAKLIEKALDRGVKVIVRTIDELRDVVARNPFDAGVNPSKLIVMFLDKEPASKTLVAPGSEEIRFSGRELFIHYPDGMGQSKLTNTYVEKKLGVISTARNLNTVTKLLAR